MASASAPDGNEDRGEEVGRNRGNRTPGAPLRVLIVEDEAMIALHLDCLVQDFGHDVVGIVRTADEAIATAGRLRPDIVLMDIRLARGDGVTAAGEIQQRFAITSIFMTAHADDDTRRRALDTAPLDYLIKPVDPVRLAGALQRAAGLGRPS